VSPPELQAALDEAFDHAVLFHGFARHLRDYDFYVYVHADPSSGVSHRRTGGTGSRTASWRRRRGSAALPAVGLGGRSEAIDPRAWRER
jgi:hypothetical protein